MAGLAGRGYGRGRWDYGKAAGFTGEEGRWPNSFLVDVSERFARLRALLDDPDRAPIATLLDPLTTHGVRSLLIGSATELELMRKAEREFHPPDESAP
jgi:hypothetical protein